MSEFIGEIVNIPPTGKGIIISRNYERDSVIVEMPDKSKMEVTGHYLRDCGELDRLRRKLYPNATEKLADAFNGSMANLHRVK